jgi:predicted MFS family arabinose efflux permease
MAVPFMGLYVTESLHRSAAEAGVIISLFGVGAIFGAMVGGKFTDLIGFRSVQIVSSVLSGMFFLLFAWVDSYQWLCVLALIISFFSEAFRPANYAAISSYASKDTETRSYSLNRLATNIGWAVGLSMGGVLASYNYKLLFIVDGGVSILVGILIYFLLPDRPKMAKVKSIAERRIARKPWNDSEFVKFLVLSLIFTSCFFLMFRVVPVFFKQVWHLDEALIGMILGVNGVIIALLEMIMVNKIENKRRPNFYIMLGVLIVAVAFSVLILPKFAPVVLAILSVVLFTFGEMFSLPFFNTFVVRRSNVHNIGLYAAGYTLSWSVAQVLGPTFGFFIADYFGYNVLWVLIAPLLLVCALLFRRLNFGE